MVHPLLHLIKINPIDAHTKQWQAHDNMVDLDDNDPDDREEKKDYEKVLSRISVSDLNLPKLPLVRVKKESIEMSEYFKQYEGQIFLLIGEILQMSEHICMINIFTREIITSIHSHDLEMLLPFDDF